MVYPVLLLTLDVAEQSGVSAGGVRRARGHAGGAGGVGVVASRRRPPAAAGQCGGESCPGSSRRPALRGAHRVDGEARPAAAVSDGRRRVRRPPPRLRRLRLRGGRPRRPAPPALHAAHLRRRVPSSTVGRRGDGGRPGGHGGRRPLRTAHPETLQGVEGGVSQRQSGWVPPDMGYSVMM